MEGSSHHSSVKHQQNGKHPPILANPTPFVPQKPAHFSQPSLHTAHRVVEDVTVRPSFHPHTLPPPPAPAPTSAFLSFPRPPSQASTARPQSIGVTKGLPDIKPFIQLGPTASSKPSPTPQQIHQNSISFAPVPNFSARKEPVQVFHHGSPLFLSQIRSIQVTSEPPTLLGTNFPTATPRNLESLPQETLQVFGPETASMQHDITLKSLFLGVDLNFARRRGFVAWKTFSTQLEAQPTQIHLDRGLNALSFSS